MGPIHRWPKCMVLAAVLCMAACAGGKDFAYRPQTEAPAGQGLFSGEDGAFTIYRKGSGPAPETERANAPGGSADPATLPAAE